MRATGASFSGAAGGGLEMLYSGGIAYLQSYNRTALSLEPLALSGSRLDLTFLSLGNYANDAAAAAAGLSVNSMYRNGSALMIRVA